MKRFIALVLSGVLVLGSAQTTFAESTPEATDESVIQQNDDQSLKTAIQPDSGFQSSDSAIQPDDSGIQSADSAIQPDDSGIQSADSTTLESPDEAEKEIRHKRFNSNNEDWETRKENAEELTLNEGKLVSLSYGERGLLKFVPEEDMQYYFYSEIANGSVSEDSYVQFFDADGIQLAYNDDGGEEYNFGFHQYLNAGVEYYLEVSEVSDEDPITMYVFVSLYNGDDDDDGDDSYTEFDYEQWTSSDTQVYGDEYSFGVRVYTNIEYSVAWYKVTGYSDYGYTPVYTRLQGEDNDSMTIILSPETDGTYMAEITYGTHDLNLYFDVQGTSIRYSRPYTVYTDYMKPVTLTADAESIYRNPLTYSWYYYNDDGEITYLEDENASTVTLPGSLLKNQYLSVFCNVDDGISNIDIPFSVRVEWFTVSRDPQYGTEFARGQDATIGVLVENAGDAELSYYWYMYDGYNSPVLESNSATCTIPSELLNQSDHSYYIECAVSCGNYSSYCSWNIYTVSSLHASLIYERNAYYGTPSLLRVEADSAIDSPITYIWYKNTSNSGWTVIESANTAEYMTEAEDMVSQEVAYKCEVSNGYDTVTCNCIMEISFRELYGSGDIQIRPGEKAVFNVYVDASVTGETYTWYEETEDGDYRRIEGENSSSLTVEAGKGDTNKKYYCWISCGDFSQSLEFNLYTQGSLRTVYSNNHYIESGNETELQVYAFSIKKNAEIRYQWQKADSIEDAYTDIPGANAASLTVHTFDMNDLDDYYRCVVTDGDQEKTCSMVVRYFPFDYAFYDENGKEIAGDYVIPSTKSATVHLEVSSMTQEPVTYQWQTYEYNPSTGAYEFMDLEGETSSSFTVTKELIDDMVEADRKWMQYYCDVHSGRFSYRMSINFWINDINYIHGVGYLSLKNNESTTLTCDAYSTGGEALQYQWYYEDSSGEHLVEGATTAECTIDGSSLIPNISYDYFCKVKTASMDSPVSCSWCTVELESPIQINGPGYVTAILGSTIFLSPFAESTEGKELSYQWYRGDGTIIPGANDSVYVLRTSELTGTECSFNCEISDGTFSMKKSIIVTLFDVKADLKAGETVSVTTDNSYYYIRFIPEEDGSYVFQSTGNYDTFGELIDSMGHRITANDDGGDNSNFKITANLKNNEAYYLKARMYGMYNGTFNVSCKYVGPSTSTEYEEDPVEYIRAGFHEKVLLSPEFEEVQGASYQWWIAKNAGYNYSRFYKINGATETSYTTDWTDINGNPVVLTENSAFIRCCMYDTEGNLVEYRTYCIGFMEFKASADDEEVVSMAQGETKTFTVDVPDSLGDHLTYKWVLTEYNGEGVVAATDCTDNHFTYTMDRDYIFRLRCIVNGSCDMEMIDFIVAPKEVNRITGVSLSLLENGNLGLNFYVTGSNRLLYSFNDEAPQQIMSEGEIIDYSPSTDGEYGDKAKYVYKITRELSSGEMADDVTLDLLLDSPWEEKTYPLNVSYTCSVAKYADQLLSDSSYSEYWPIVRNMINYGTAAQTYFGYNTENPVADLVTHMTAADKTVKDLTAAQLAGYGTETPEGTEGLTYYGSSLLLTSATNIRHYFIVEEGYDISDFGFVANRNLLSAGTKGNLYYVDVPAGAYGSSDAKTLLTIYSSSGKSTLEYSVRDYIAKAYSGADREFKNLLNTLWG